MKQGKAETCFQSTGCGGCAQGGGEEVGTSVEPVPPSVSSQQGNNTGGPGLLGVRASSCPMFRGQLRPVEPGRAPRGDI